MKNEAACKKTFEIDIDGMGNRIECVLTPLGEAEVRDYLQKLAAKRKEILDAGKDTADNTNLPTEDDIISDIETWFGTDGLPHYCNNWDVTDEYEADFPLCLYLGHEIVTVEAAKALKE
jgi:hypothetical protein